MKNLSPLVRVPVKYGIFGGILAFILLFTLFFLGRFPFIPVERTLLFAVFIFFALKEYRDYYQEGFMHFWQGMMGGIICYVTMALIASLILVIWGQIDDAYLVQYIDVMTEQIETNRTDLEERMGKEVINNQLVKLPLTTTLDLAFDYLLKSMFIGIFLTIIISVILRRQPKNT
jgi:hypothetical protein